MNLKKIILSGLIAGFIAFVVGSILYMNPLTAGLYEQYGNWTGTKSMETFGGFGNWIALMMVGGLISSVFVAFLYSYTEKGIGIKETWKKGSFFGILIWLVATLPVHYNIWLMYSYPEILLAVETFNSLIGCIVMGIMLAVAYERIK